MANPARVGAVRLTPVEWLWDVEVVNVVDGDTIDAVVSRVVETDHGFRSYSSSRFDAHGPLRFRITEIDTPEITKEPERAQAAKEFTERWVTNRILKGITYKPTRPLPDGAFGRWLIDVFDSFTGEHLNAALREAGHIKAPE